MERKMNQILSTNMQSKSSKKGQKGPADIKKVITVFAIIVIIFAIGLIGIGGYTILLKNNDKVEIAEKPIITLENKSETVILLKVMHNTGTIDQIYYSWNDDAEININGNDRKYVEQTIQIPSGSNMLHIRVVDSNGQEVTYEKQYEIESNINFEVSGSKIKIMYEGDTKVSYITYRWDDEDEKKIDINDTVVNQEIEALKGLHTLTVVVVDENNKTDTKSQKINGVSKPNLTIDSNDDNTKFVVDVSDDEELNRIEIVLNGDRENKYVIKLEDFHVKEFNYTLPIDLETGENVIEVTVYNASGITTVQNGQLVKQ